MEKRSHIIQCIRNFKDIENLADILETPNIAPKILDIMSGYKE